MRRLLCYSFTYAVSKYLLKTDCVTRTVVGTEDRAVKNLEWRPESRLLRSSAEGGAGSSGRNGDA